MIRFIDEQRNRFGVEPICRVLGATEGGFISSRGYRAAKVRPASNRALSDRLLGEELVRLYATYVRTWSGFAYVAFVTDVYSRRIVGWNVASTLRADVLPLQALDMAAWDADGDLAGLTHHSDHGSNYMSLVYTDRIVELGATPSTGTVGDSYDNALADAVNGLYKTELVRRRGPWKTVEQVELATWNTCGGGTTSAFTRSSTTAPRSRSSKRTTLTTNHPGRPRLPKPTTRNETQGDSTAGSAGVQMSQLAT